MYKFIDDTTIKRLSDGAFIPVYEGNSDYEQFKTDVVGIGTTCVVGIDTVTTVDYTDARKSEYPLPRHTHCLPGLKVFNASPSM